MIALPRSLARRFRAVLRRSSPNGRQAGPPPSVLLRVGEQGLCLEATRPDVAVRLEHPGKQSEAVLAFPADALALFEGRTDETVQLEAVAFGKGQASWAEGGSEVRKDFPTLATDGLPPFPEPPARLRQLDETFLRALDEAGAVTARDSARYALERILLRGKGCHIVASDARQLLVQSGFDLPWPDDALVPRLGVWGMKELPPKGPVGIGRTKNHVFVQVGPWTFALFADPAARFPAYETIIPRASSRVSTLRLGPEDITLLTEELPKLAADRELPATLELGPDVMLRAEPRGKEPVELRLVGSRWSGPPLRVVLGPRYLLHALGLGFADVEVRSASQPLCCRDSRRTYLWMPFGDPPAPSPAAAVPPRAAAAENPSPLAPSPEPVKEPAMPRPADNGRHPNNGDSAPPTDPAALDPLAEAEAVRALLAEAQSRLGRLAAILKQHRRQARAVAAAMAQLRNLPLGP